MNGAVVWYQSRSVWGAIVALIIAAALHFGITLPWDKDSIINFFLEAVPIVVALEGRLTSTKQIAATPAKAAVINSTATIPLPAPVAEVLKDNATNLADVVSKIVPVMVCFLMVGMLAGLTGCASLSDGKLEQTVCSHQIVTTNAAEAALTAAVLIKDPYARQAAISAANATLALVAGCPGYAGPVPVTP